MKGDEAFYFTHRDNELIGMVMTHVDDFVMTGTEDFLEEIERKIKISLTVSKVEKDKFRFTGIDIERTEDGVKMSMEDYVGSITEIEEIRTGEKTEALTKIENKLYRKYVGKISWLAENCRPDLSIIALKLARKSMEPKLEDLHHIY